MTSLAFSGSTPGGKSIVRPRIVIVAGALAFCDIEVPKPVYLDGEQLAISELRYANQTAGSVVGGRLVLQLDVGGVFTGTLISAGPIELVPGFDFTAGPIGLFPIGPAMPRGTWAVRCAIEDFATGAIVDEGFSTFEVE